MASYLGKYADYVCVVGAVSVGYVVLTLSARLLRVTARAIRRCFPVDPKRYGRWAVVTGCTDGIGKSYALQLAEKGMDIVLIARNPQKLSAVADHIVEHHKVAVKVITADFKHTDIYHTIRQQLAGLDIGILVNNVGMLNRRSPCYFLEAEDFEQYNRDVINVNILSVVMMTAIVLPEMLERKRGAIINISSMSGLKPLPFFTVYSASKAFNCFFSRALNMEYSSQGVTIQVVTPAMVRSNMTKDYSQVSMSGKGCLFPTCDDFVKAALKTLGRESDTIAYWPHELQYFLFSGQSDSTLTQFLLAERNMMSKLLKQE